MLTMMRGRRRLDCEVWNTSTYLALPIFSHCPAYTHHKSRGLAERALGSVLLQEAATSAPEGLIRRGSPHWVLKESSLRAYYISMQSCIRKNTIAMSTVRCSKSGPGCANTGCAVMQLVSRLARSLSMLDGPGFLPVAPKHRDVMGALPHLLPSARIAFFQCDES